MVKINKIAVTGLRGIRHELEIPLKGKSALLYGDNGSGKSTLADVLEWFYYDKIGHLSGEEIGRKGYEALRNIFLAEEDPGLLKMTFNKSDYDCVKSIESKKGSLKALVNNESDNFADYIEASSEEKLILRYRELAAFILASKSDKLRALSEIIGYGKVTDTRDTLRKTFNRLSKEIKTKGFDNQINHQQSQIIEQFDQNITSDDQFIEIVKEITKPFELKIEVTSLKDINDVLKKIKKPDDSKEVKQEAFLVKVGENLVTLADNIDELEKLYKAYTIKFNTIATDIDKLKKLAIEKLLTAGNELLLSENYTAAHCPLCLEDQDITDLMASVKSRIGELEEIKKEQKALSDSRTDLNEQITTILRLLQPLIDDKQAEEEINVQHKANIEGIIKSIENYQDVLKIKVTGENKIPELSTLLVDRKKIDSLGKECKAQIVTIRKARKKDPKWDAHGKIKIAGHAYAQIRRLRKEQAAFEKQRDSMEIIYRSFLKKQKEALESFLETFSEKINDIYQFLNPGEKVENIKLVPIEKDDELSGITVQFDFFESKDVTPPHKFLSESHINCLGIAFFLTSVDAFNVQNRFIVLDDVISSFDTNHRKRFADLLIEEYSDYQVILLTHEKAWFDIVKNLVKGKSWHINTIKYNQSKGTHLDEEPQTLKQRIEEKIENQDESGLGNDARKYLEHILKLIALNLEVKVPFKYNSVNEDRMAFELLTFLKGTVDKRKCSELINNNTLSRLLGSLFIGNKDSHDSSYEPTFADMKAFWQDIIDFEKLFFCDQCNSQVSLRYYDEGNKIIKCKKGELEYSWKK